VVASQFSWTLGPHSGFGAGVAIQWVVVVIRETLRHCTGTVATAIRAARDARLSEQSKRRTQSYPGHQTGIIIIEPVIPRI
jgi:hypothetical protein